MKNLARFCYSCKGL